MDSLKISTGVIPLNIVDDNGDSRGIFKFNPSDLGTAEKFMNMQNDFELKQIEFTHKVESLEQSQPNEQISFMNEVCDYFKNSIDEIFGDGSSNILFGDAKTFGMFTDFFEGISPFYQIEANKKMQKHTAKYKK